MTPSGVVSPFRGKLPKGLTEDGAEDLVELERRHADELFSVVDANRDHLGRWLLWVPRTRSVADTERFIRELTERRAEGKGYVYAIRRDGRLVGCVGLEIDADDGWGEIGYWLSEDAEGRGTMTRAVRAVIDLAFADLRLPRVEIRCAVGNGRSRAVAERLGFALEGTLRARAALPDGSRSDEYLYGLVPGAWTPDDRTP